jgi:hypothetical protein
MYNQALIYAPHLNKRASVVTVGHVGIVKLRTYHIINTKELRA